MTHDRISSGFEPDCFPSTKVGIAAALALPPAGAKAVKVWLQPQQVHAFVTATSGCHWNAELGRSHTPLPVVHTKEIWPRQRGLYMYYARGCSDVMWDPGRTVAASNRLQLAVKLTRLQLGCNRSTAHGLVTRFLRTPFQVAAEATTGDRSDECWGGTSCAPTDR